MNANCIVSLHFFPLFGCSGIQCVFAIVLPAATQVRRGYSRTRLLREDMREQGCSPGQRLHAPAQCLYTPANLCATADSLRTAGELERSTTAVLAWWIPDFRFSLFSRSSRSSRGHKRPLQRQSESLLIAYIRVLTLTFLTYVQFCLLRPKAVDGARVHDYCSKSCAQGDKCLEMLASLGTSSTAPSFGAPSTAPSFGAPSTASSTASSLGTSPAVPPKGQSKPLRD
jgi:hypothetical protein